MRQMQLIFSIVTARGFNAINWKYNNRFPLIFISREELNSIRLRTFITTTFDWDWWFIYLNLNSNV